MVKRVTFTFSNGDYQEKYDIVEEEKFNTETLEFEKISVKKPLPHTEEEIAAAKNNKNYKLASVLVNIIAELGGASTLELNKISFILPDENVEIA